jgi:type II secretory pathway pseudopilin PulG
MLAHLFTMFGEGTPNRGLVRFERNTSMALSPTSLRRRFSHTAMIRTRNGRRCGWTLVELLVIIAVAGFLVAICLTKVQKARIAAARSECINNLRQVVLGSINCTDTYGSRLPPLAGPFPNAKSTGTIFFHILPFIEKQQLYTTASDGKNGYRATSEDLHLPG